MTSTTPDTMPVTPRRPALAAFTASLLVASLTMLGACSTASTAAVATPPATGVAPPTPGPLFDTLAALDQQVFDAFNRCDQPGQLERHAAFFAPGVEFYHDNGGVTWTREAMLANTRQHVCGKFRRELVPGTLRVYPIKDFGAIAQGVHRFCAAGGDRCEGAADFVIVWRQDAGAWTITRVLSYGHRPN